MQLYPEEAGEIDKRLLSKSDDLIYAYLVKDLEQLGPVHEGTRSGNRSVNLQVLFSVQQLGLIDNVGLRKYEP